MATVNDRITRLEDAFINQQELNREIVGLLREHGGLLREHGGLLRTIISTQNEHTALFKEVISALQDHSIDIKLIKEHLG